MLDRKSVERSKLAVTPRKRPKIHDAALASVVAIVSFALLVSARASATHLASSAALVEPRSHQGPQAIQNLLSDGKNGSAIAESNGQHFRHHIIVLNSGLLPDDDPCVFSGTCSDPMSNDHSSTNPSSNETPAAGTAILMNRLQNDMDDFQVNKRHNEAELLESLAKQYFGPHLMTPMETQLLQGLARFGFASSTPLQDGKNIPVLPSEIPNDQFHAVRGEFIRWLLRDPEAEKHLPPGLLNIVNVKILGTLDLSYSTISHDLVLQNCDLTNGISLVSAHVRNLTLTGSRLAIIPYSRIAMDAYRLVTLGDMNLNYGFEAEGTVTAEYADIGGRLKATGGQFRGTPAISIKGAAISGDVLLNQDPLEAGAKPLPGFTAKGQVDLSDARVSGSVLFDGGVIEHSTQEEPIKVGNPLMYAINAENIHVKGNVSMSDRFKSDGVVYFGLADVGGFFGSIGGTFGWPTGVERPSANTAEYVAAAPSLVELSQIGVARGIKFSQCTVDGVVKLVEANVQGDVMFDGPRFTGSSMRGLDASAAQIGGNFMWAPAGPIEHTILKLDDAKARGLWDLGSSWPSTGNLMVSGFKYFDLRSDKRAPDDRLEWLSRQSANLRSAPQPFTQIASVYRDRGQDADSVTILVARERARWRTPKADMLKQPRSAAGPSAGLKHVAAAVYAFLQEGIYSLWSAILDATIGYGYRPERAVWWLLLLIFLGWQIFAQGHAAGLLVPTESSAYKSLSEKGLIPDSYPRFSGFIYSLEKSLPLVTLDQGEFWQPAPGADARNFSFIGVKFRARSLRYYLRLHILLGWFFSTMFVAGLTGLVHS